MFVCCFSFQMGPTGKAVGVEHIKELVHESIRNVQEDDPTLLSSGRVKLVGELSGILVLLPPRDGAFAVAPAELCFPEQLLPFALMLAKVLPETSG